MSSGRITARTWSGRNRPSAVSSGRSCRPAITDAPATSFWKMWLSTSRMTSSPGWVWLRRAQRLPIVPLGTKREASLPTICAARSWRRWMVGSSSQTSSPTSAVAIAARIDSVGNVKVSLRSSTVRVTRRSLSPELRVNQRAGSDHVRNREVRLPLDIHLHPGLQGARGQVRGGLELLRVADHEQRERRAQGSSADQQVLTSADDRCAADDAVAVERKGLGARVSETVERVLELEVHDRALDPNLQSWSSYRDLATDLAQDGQFLFNPLGVGTAGGERLAQLRFLLRQCGSLLDQLVVGAVEVVDQQRHAGFVLGGERPGHRRLRAELDHKKKPERQPDQADHDQPLGPCRAISRGVGHISSGRSRRTPGG